METLRYVVLVNGLLAVVSLAYYVLLRRETFFGANRLALWVGFAGAVILPLLELPDWRPQPVRKVMARTAQIIVPRVLPKTEVTLPEVTITFPNQRTYKAFRAQSRQWDWSWQMGLIVLYGVIVWLLLVRFGLRLLSLQRLIRQSDHEPYDDFTLVINQDIVSPFSFFNWVVLNPNQHTLYELEQILRHERVHVRDRHSLDMIGMELACIAFWFNPAVYLFRHLLCQTLEFSADRAVLAEGVEARSYQYNLLKVTMAARPCVFTNQFTGPTLRQRIAMMNSRRSGLSAWWRYGVWVMLMGAMAVACRHAQTSQEEEANGHVSPYLLTNATRTLASELDQRDMPWFRQSSLLSPDKTVILKGSGVAKKLFFDYPEILCLKENHLNLKNTDTHRVKLFINGQETDPVSLSTLTFDEVEDLLVYQKWEDAAGAEKYPEAYRIFISTTHKTPESNPIRTKWKKFLLANAVSEHPLGKSNTFSMNKLLEATFFSNKLAFVMRTKDDHLKLYDEFATDIDLFINGLPASPKDIEGVHVREVDKLYTRERSFEDWVNEPNRKHRFAMYIQTSPKRAKRDSSYYVFSPFYTGDF